MIAGQQGCTGRWQFVDDFQLAQDSECRCGQLTANHAGIEQLQRCRQSIAGTGLRLDIETERAQMIDVFPHGGARNAELAGQHRAGNHRMPNQQGEQSVQAHR